MMRAWCLRSPNGKLHVDTLRATRSEAWYEGYPLVCRSLGEKWAACYWKRFEPSMRSALKHGWRIVRVHVAEDA